MISLERPPPEERVVLRPEVPWEVPVKEVPPVMPPVRPVLPTGPVPRPEPLRCTDFPAPVTFLTRLRGLLVAIRIPPVFFGMVTV